MGCRAYHVRGLVAVVGVLACIGTAQAASVKTELGHLLRTHPRLAAAKERVKGAGQTIREAKSAFYPKARVFGGYGGAIIDSPALEASTGRDFRGDTNDVGADITLNLFDGFRKYGELARRRLEKSTAELDEETIRQALMFQGITAYINVLRQTRLVELAGQRERRIQVQLRLEDERVRKGAGLSVDVLQAKSRLQLAKQLRAQIDGDLQTAMARYIQVFGRTPRPGRMVDPQPPLTSIPPSLEAALKSARTDNPQVRKSNIGIDIAGQKRRVAASGYYPKFDLVLLGRRQENVDGIIGVREELAVVVRLTWQLFDGFATRSRVARATRERAEARDNHRFVQRRVRQDARIAWHRLLITRKRRDLLINAVNIAEAVFRARRALRARGKETVLNVLDAENEVNNARIQLTAAKYDAILAVYRLYFTLGILRPATIGLKA